MADVVEIAPDTDKENVVLKENLHENNNQEKTQNEEKEEKTAESFFSPPRKKLKQDALPFPKISKEEAFKHTKDSIDLTVAREEHETTDTVMEEEKPPASNTPKGKGQQDSVPPSPATTPSQKKKIIKSPALSKEEREKQRQEKEKLKQERLKEQEEKRKQKDEEKKRKEEERLQKQAEKEKKELEKKIEKEKREQERKEKERLREEERKKKEDERKKKEEQRDNERRAREAEKEKKEAERKLEEEKKRLKEEAEKKKKEKAANQFRSFFTKKTSVEKKQVINESTELSRFANFQVTKNMILAPCVRREDFDKSILDTHIEKEVQDCSTYLEELAILFANSKKPTLVTRRQLRKDYETSRKKENEEKQITDSEPKAKRRKSAINGTSDVVIIEDENSNDNSSDEDDDDETSFIEEKRLMRAKFLKFEENTRPPYYGTWRKKTKSISGRRPFGQDVEIFNYDIDSDEEWIDEPGEDCSDNGEDDEEEEKETEEDQDGFFVPHGYLSDDEGVPDESDDENNDGDGDGVAPIALSKDAADGLREQEKLKSKANSFEVVFQKKFKPKKPICIGIKFTNNVDNLDPVLKDFFKISLYRSKGDSSEVAAGEDGDKDVNNKVMKGLNDVPENGCTIPQTVPEEAMPFLLKHLHGNQSSITKMMNEFKAFWIEYIKTNNLTDVRSHISKKQFQKKIQAISTKGNNPKIGKMCYTVNQEILNQYGLLDLELGIGLTNPISALEKPKPLIKSKDLDLSDNVSEQLAEKAGKELNGNGSRELNENGRKESEENAPVEMELPIPVSSSSSRSDEVMEVD